MGGDLGERNHPDNRKSPYMTFNLDNYEPVAPRLARWLEAAEDPRVITTLIAYEPGKWCIFKTDLYEGEKLISTGHAYEEHTEKGVNSTSTWRTVRRPARARFEQFWHGRLRSVQAPLS
jgi:hypothetical protein